MGIQAKAVILALAILVSGCRPSTREQAIVRECPSVDAGDYFFPIGVLDAERSDMDEFIRNGYSEHLRVMQEPSLSCGKNTAEFTYRFLWLRSFHNPICVRIERNDSSTTLNAVELDLVGGHAPGQIAKRVQKALSPAQEKRLMAKLKRLRFWEMQTSGGIGGLDGAEWILEGSRDSQYRVVDRWSPESGSFRDVCLLFLEFAGFLTPGTKIY